MSYTIDQLITQAQVFLASGDPQLAGATGTTNFITWWNTTQQELCDQTRWWFMRKSYSQAVTVAGGNGPYNTAWSSSTVWINLVMNGATRLEGSIPLEQAQALYSGATSGPPVNYSWDPSGETPNLYVWPVPDLTYTLTVVTFDRLADLASGQSNYLTDIFPNFVRTVLIRMGFDRLQEDQEIQKWEAREKRWLETLQQRQREAINEGLFSVPAPSYSAPHGA